MSALPSSLTSRRVAVIGAGPAGLAAAEVLAGAGVAVTVFERMANPARKFLLAGRGGLNLTHSEPLETFVQKYGAARGRLESVIRSFPPEALRDWCEGLGVETFVGTSGRVFPKAMKASPLLRAWLRRLDGMGVAFERAMFVGWAADGALKLSTAEGEREERFDASVFALGGASWPRLGSDGSWRASFEDKGVEIAPLRPANSGFVVAWSDILKSKFAGAPLKSARFSFQGQETRGEAIVTENGIEGGAIYALSAALREAVLAEGFAELEIDLAPDVSANAVAKKLGDGSQSAANRLRRAALSPLAASLLRERVGGPGLPAGADELALTIKSCVIRLTGVAGIERAISTAGGVSWDSVANDFSLRVDPSVFVAGEMLDWEAPTGGYLLQACFATGRAAGLGVLARLQA